MEKTEQKEAMVNRSYQLRAYESNCEIEHPDAEDLAFRHAIAKSLGQAWNLRDLRPLTYQPLAKK